MKPSFHSKKHRTIHPLLFFAITYLYCYIIVFTSVFVSIIVFSLYKPLTINLLPKFLCVILAISIFINHCSLNILKTKTNHSINHFLEWTKALSTIITLFCTLFSLITELTTIENIEDAYSQQVITTIDSWTTQSFIFGILAMNFHILHFGYHFFHSFQPKKRSATHLKYAKRHRRNRILRKTKKRPKNTYHSLSQNILFRYLRREWIFPSSSFPKSFSITTKTVSNKKKNKRKNG